MLGYYINNKPLALSPNTSVRIIRYNSACFFDEIPGDVAMGIELEANEVNAALFGNPDRFDKFTIKSNREFSDFEIRFSGYILIAGTLVIQSANNESYSGWCRNNVGNLGKKHRDKFIHEIPAFNQTKTFQNKANYNHLTDPYACPTHFNPEFFRDKGHIVTLKKSVPNPDYVDLTWWQDLTQKQQPATIWEEYKTEAFTEAFRKSTSWFVNKLDPDNKVITMGSTSLIKRMETDLFVNVLSPMLFLNYLLEMLFRDSKFFISRNAIKNHVDLERLILYNNFDITHVDFVTEYTRMTQTVEIMPAQGGNPDIKILFGTPIVPDITSAAINQTFTYTVSSIQTIKRSYDGTFIYRDLLPKIALKDFLLSIQNLLNVCFQFHRDGKVDIVDREAIIDSVPIDIDKYLVNGWTMGDKKDVTLKFLFGHDDNDILFSEKWVDVDDRRINEGDRVQTADELLLIQNPKFGEIRYIINSNLYAEYTWIQESQVDPKTGDPVQVDILGWKHLATGFQNGFFNRKKLETEEIKTDFSTLFGQQTVMTHHKGNMETTKLAYEGFTPRLLFYMGNNVAKHETANLTLDWENSEKGLLAKRWPKWNRFWCQRQPVSTAAMFTINMIDYVGRNITNKFRCREGEFIIETMETEYSLETIGNTKISGWKNTYNPFDIGLDEHWSLENLIFDDTLIDFENIGLILDTNLDLFPFGEL